MLNMKVKVILIEIGTLGTVKGTGGFGNKRVCEDHPNYSIVEIGQDAEKNTGDWKRLSVNQTPVRNYQ